MLKTLSAGLLATLLFTGALSMLTSCHVCRCRGRPTQALLARSGNAIAVGSQRLHARESLSSGCFNHLCGMMTESLTWRNARAGLLPFAYNCLWPNRFALGIPYCRR